MSFLLSISNHSSRVRVLNVSVNACAISGRFTGVVFVRNEILAAERAAQVGEEPRLDRRDGNVFVVLGQIDIVVRNPAVVYRLTAPGHFPVCEKCRERLRQQREAAVHHRDVDVLPTPGLVARNQRREHSDRSMHPATGIVRDHVVRDSRRLAGPSEHRQHARGRDVIDVVADQVTIRPGLSETRDRTIDQPWIARRKFLVIDSEPLGDARPVFLDDNVRALSEPAVDFFARAALEIDSDRLLVARQRVVGRAVEAVARRDAYRQRPLAARVSRWEAPAPQS